MFERIKATVKDPQFQREVLSTVANVVVTYGAIVLTKAIINTAATLVQNAMTQKIEEPIEATVVAE